MRRTTTVPIIADAELKRRLAVLAARRGLPMAALVREAVDAVFGAQLEREGVFVESSGQIIFHSETDTSND